MGCGEKTTTQNSQTASATPEETELNKQQIAMNNFMRPYAQQTYGNLSNNINAILTGQTPQAQGIGGVSDAQNQSMVNQSVRSVLPQFQSAGILDSGIAFQGATRAAQDTSNQNAQFNVSAAQNLFNLASGGQSNLQGQLQGGVNSLSSQLAGLRTVNQSGSTIGMNPFLKSMQTSAGQSFNLGQYSWAGGGGAKGTVGSCWVAAEIFDGWSDIRTNLTRFYIIFHSPKWFRNTYIKYGEKFAKFISNKTILKNILRPLFELMVSRGGKYATNSK